MGIIAALVQKIFRPPDLHFGNGASRSQAGGWMKVAVVTGAAQGVGFATAQLLAQSGYHVAIVDVQPLSTQLAALTDAGAVVTAHSGDISDERFVDDLAAQILHKHGRADVLVNNAGISLICPAESTSLDQWQRVISVNLAGPFLLSRAFGSHMLERGSGSIVNVASIAGLHGVITHDL